MRSRVEKWVWEDNCSAVGDLKGVRSETTRLAVVATVTFGGKAGDGRDRGEVSMDSFGTCPHLAEPRLEPGVEVDVEPDAGAVPGATFRLNPGSPDPDDAPTSSP